MKTKVAISLTTFAEYDSTGLDFLNEKGFEVIKNSLGRKLNKKETLGLCSDCVGIVAGTEKYDFNILKKLSSIKVISRCGSGMDNVDLEAASKLGIKVYNTPDAPTEAVAELTIGLLLSLLRKIPLMDRELRTGTWKKRMGNLLSGKQVGIIGYGRIGRKVAEFLKTMNAQVFFYDPFVSEEETSTGSKEGFQELLETSDIVTLHLSLAKKNRGLLGPQEFSQMKQGALLINCSRGGIVDENALYSALKEGKLSGAAVDVFENEPYLGPLKDLDNVILTPHIGSYARETRIEMEMQAVKNLLDGLGK